MELRTLVAIWVLLVALGLPCAAQAGEDRSSASRPLAVTTLPIPDGAVLYVRYGEPGGVNIRSHYSATDSLPTVDPAAPSPPALEETVVDDPPNSEDLLRRIRNMVREELAGLHAVQGAPSAPSTSAGPSTSDIFPPRPVAEASPVVVDRTGVIEPPAQDPTAQDPVVVSMPDVISPTIVREQIAHGGLFRTNLILFETSSAALLPRSQDVISTIGSVLAEFPEARIRVEGHADPRGTEESNQALSERRAESVREFLLDCCGLDPARLEAAGFGETRPLVSGASPTALALNRRVEFRVLNPESLRSSEEAP